MIKIKSLTYRKISTLHTPNLKMYQGSNSAAFENPFVGISAIYPFVKAGSTRIKDIILENVPGFISPNALSELLESDI